jgi:hypothetical protein
VKIELPADLAAHGQELADRAEALAREIAVLHQRIRAADDESVRRAGFRCLTTVDWLRQVADELRDASADLYRIRAATTAPGTCSVPWGACPDHGNTLISTGGMAWCRDLGCQRQWNYDRVALPCAEPARWTITDQCGGTGVMCNGHALDATSRIEGARVAPLLAAERRESA